MSHRSVEGDDPLGGTQPEGITAGQKGYREESKNPVEMMMQWATVVQQFGFSLTLIDSKSLGT